MLEPTENPQLNTIMEKTCSKCGERKPISDFGSNGPNRRRSSCLMCERKRDKERPARNTDPQKVAERQRKYRERNLEKLREKDRLYYANNAKKVKDKVANWKAENPEKERKRRKEYIQKNRAKFAAKWATRKARKIKATPAWADMKKIEAVYAEAKRLTDETGIPHEVDHIVPLRGEKACGLHVHQNLRVITAEENREKSNKPIEIDGVEYF